MQYLLFLSILSVAAKASKHAWKQWAKEGRPRGDNLFFKNYKACKKSFRHAHRLAKQEFETKEMSEVCRSQEINVKYFWYMVNKRKSKCN